MEKKLVLNYPDIVKDLIIMEFEYRDFHFQRLRNDGTWYVTYDNHIVNCSMYRNDLKEWIDSLYKKAGDTTSDHVITDDIVKNNIVTELQNHFGVITDVIDDVIDVRGNHYNAEPVFIEDPCLERDLQTSEIIIGNNTVRVRSYSPINNGTVSLNGSYVVLYKILS